MVAQEGQKPSSSKQETTFRARQRGLEVRVEKLNSHPRAQDFDRHSRVSVSFFFIWSLLIHHFTAIPDNDLESSFIAARFASGPPELLGDCAAAGSIVRGVQIMQRNSDLIASRLKRFPAV